MNRCFRLFGVILVTFALGACANTAEPKKGTALYVADANASIDVHWKHKVGSGAGDRFLRLPPTVSAQGVFGASYDGHVLALTRQGEKQWEQTVSASITAPPAVSDRFVAVVDETPSVSLMSVKTGDILWHRRIQAMAVAAPALSEDAVIVQTMDGRVNALSLKDGQWQWGYEREVPSLQLSGGSAPVVYKDRVVVAYPSGKLVVLDVNDGHFYWEKQVAAPHGRSELKRMVDIIGSPVVSGSEIYVATFQGKVAAISLHSGHVIWERPMSVTAPLTLSGRTLYVVDDTGIIRAIDADSGNKRWVQKRLFRHHLTGSAVLGDTLVVSDEAGWLYGLSPKDGHFTARGPVSKKIYAPPVKLNNKEILVMDAFGRLNALGVAKKS